MILKAACGTDMIDKVHCSCSVQAELLAVCFNVLKCKKNMLVTPRLSYG